MLAKDSFTLEDLIECGRGNLFGPGNAQLPLPPLLMFDRIININATGGKHGKGIVVAEFDVTPTLWFFDCHFQDDPVMPGCLGLDAMWQLIGFYLAWVGGPGRGRALGVGMVKYGEQVTPDNILVTYEVHIKRLMKRKLYLGVADGIMKVDGQEIYQARDLKVGLFVENNTDHKA